MEKHACAILLWGTTKQTATGG